MVGIDEAIYEIVEKITKSYTELESFNYLMKKLGLEAYFKDDNSPCEDCSIVERSLKYGERDYEIYFKNDHGRKGIVKMPFGSYGDIKIDRVRKDLSDQILVGFTTSRKVGIQHLKISELYGVSFCSIVDYEDDVSQRYSQEYGVDL